MEITENGSWMERFMGKTLIFMEMTLNEIIFPNVMKKL